MQLQQNVLCLLCIHCTSFVTFVYDDPFLVISYIHVKWTSQVTFDINFSTFLHQILFLKTELLVKKERF